LLSLRLEDRSIEGESGSAHQLEESPSVTSPTMVGFLPNPGWRQREVINPLLSGPTCAGSTNIMASNVQMAHGDRPELQATHCDEPDLQTRLMVDGLEIQAKMMAGNLLAARPELPSQTPQTSDQLPQSPALGSSIPLFDELRTPIAQPPPTNKNLKVYSRRRSVDVPRQLLFLWSRLRPQLLPPRSTQLSSLLSHVKKRATIKTSQAAALQVTVSRVDQNPYSLRRLIILVMWRRLRTCALYPLRSS
jgi:hypothetical protein